MEEISSIFDGASPRNLFAASERLDNTAVWDKRTIITSITESGQIDGKKAYEGIVDSHDGYSSLASLSKEVLAVPVSTGVPFYIMAYVTKSTGRTATAGVGILGVDGLVVPQFTALWVDTTTGEGVLEEAGEYVTRTDYGVTDLGGDEYFIWLAATWTEPALGWYSSPNLRIAPVFPNAAGTSIFFSGDGVTPLGKVTGLHGEFSTTRPTYSKRGI